MARHVYVFEWYDMSQRVMEAWNAWRWKHMEL